jgi:hypothetical protein
MAGLRDACITESRLQVYAACPWFIENRERFSLERFQLRPRYIQAVDILGWRASRPPATIVNKRSLGYLISHVCTR